LFDSSALLLTVKQSFFNYNAPVRLFVGLGVSFSLAGELPHQLSFSELWQA
jgi:hypothetical protein